MATKHEQILSYIDSLDVGEKISVRRIAKEMKVSEGTAYQVSKMLKIKDSSVPLNESVPFELNKRKKKILKN